MTLGWCARVAESGRVRNMGFDYLEVALAPMQIDNDAAFRAARAAVIAAGVPTPVFNQFLPQGLPVVGPDVDPPRIRRYLARAAEVMHAAAAEFVVFGSGWARNVPQGWNRADADEQFLETVSWCTDAFNGTGIQLALESQNVKETNLLTTVAEAARLSRAIDRSDVRIIADTYHLHEMGEGLDVVQASMDQIVHVHISDSNRNLPGDGVYDFAAFATTLRTCGYDGRLSIEMMRDVTDDEMRRGLAFVRQLRSIATGS
jgi:sugar phosphate isomerase/epimerase